MENAAFKLPMKVRDYEVDSEGIVNNACYLNYLEHTRHEFCESAGLSFADMRRRGMSPVVRSVSITYLSSLGLGYEFVSCLKLTRRGPRFIFHQWILTPDGRPVVNAEVTVVNIINGRPTRGEELAEAFKDYLLADEL
ncbi:MAG: acyl-CoA thioesterase [Muribaculaceae bacterium]|nr:acyl-CoA thioesterase [Muribaculaceae bacterium]